jgi:hypothetical protein
MTANTVQTKLVHIVSSRPPKDVAVEICPQDTASDVLERAGLSPNDMLMKPGDQADYSPTDLPFNDVPDGAKLHVVAHSIVGGGRS